MKGEKTMKTYVEIISDLKAGLKGILSADNTEAVAALDKQIDELSGLHEEDGKKIGELKETLVSYVKNTSFKLPKNENPDDDIDDAPKSVDDIMKETIEEIIKNRK